MGIAKGVPARMLAAIIQEKQQNQLDRAIRAS
jgi:hypothetical protein